MFSGGGGGGDKILGAKSVRMLNMAAMLKNLLQNCWADISETWYVATGTLANHCLFK